MSRNSLRRLLSMPDMLRVVCTCLHRVPDPIRARDISLSDCLTSALAVFSSRTPSLLQFDRQVRGGGDPVMARNLRPLFGVGRVPTDIWMRQWLPDGITAAGHRRRGRGATVRRGRDDTGSRVPAGNP